MSQKTINIIIFILVVGAIILGGVSLAKASPKNNLPPGQQPPGEGPKGGLGEAFGDILNNVLTGNWWQNIFGNKCDSSRPCYRKNGKRDDSCCADTYEPYVSTCNPNECDPAKPGYDKCGNFKIGC